MGPKHESRALTSKTWDLATIFIISKNGGTKEYDQRKLLGIRGTKGTNLVLKREGILQDTTPWFIGSSSKGWCRNT